MRKPVLAVSDIHFHSFKQHSKLIGGVNTRLLEIQSAWEHAIDIGRSHGCGLIAMPGDVFEIRGVLKASVYNRVTRLVSKALDDGFCMVAIPGNHDMEQFEGGDSAIDSWDLLKGDTGHSSYCKIIRKLEVVNIAGYSVMGIPYMHDTAKFENVFRELNKSEAPWHHYDPPGNR